MYKTCALGGVNMNTNIKAYLNPNTNMSFIALPQTLAVVAVLVYFFRLFSTFSLAGTARHTFFFFT